LWAVEKDPRAEIPGTTTRFRFGQDNRFAIIGPIIAIIVVVIIGLYSLPYLIGDGAPAPAAQLRGQR
jgi:hypothetical protein